MAFLPSRQDLPDNVLPVGPGSLDFHAQIPFPATRFLGEQVAFSGPAAQDSAGTGNLKAFRRRSAGFHFHGPIALCYP
jgi:hypothetical protein